MPINENDDSSVTENSMTLEAINKMATDTARVIDVLKQAPDFDSTEQQLLPSRTYTITEVSRMVGKTAEGIRKAEKQGKLTPPPIRENGRREPYTLKLVNEMRDYWNCRPGRGPYDDPILFSFQNFKGGVGKSTLTCHCAQYLAQQGYRVLLIDCDSQGSSSITFGYFPDSEVGGDDTLLPFLQGEADSLEYAIKSTHWDGLDLIPANLYLYSAEYSLNKDGADEEGGWINRLGRGVSTVQDDYDIILFDPPPALGLISLSVLRALDGLIVPTLPAMYDFHSTCSFFEMLSEVMEEVGEYLGTPVELEFLKVLVSKHYSGRQAHEFVRGVMAETYGTNVLLNPFVQSAEIDNASTDWKTVYDLSGATSSRQTYKRCVQSLDAVFGEVNELIEGVWQSRQSEDDSSLASELSQAHTLEETAEAV